MNSYLNQPRPGDQRLQQELLVNEVARLLLQCPELREACRERMRMIDMLVSRAMETEMGKRSRSLP